MLLLVSRDGELVFCRKGEFSEQDKKDFYHYYATLMEPWDGPASIVFSDGDLMGMEMKPYGSEREREAQRAIAEAWKIKYQQAERKAKMLFGASFQEEMFGKDVNAKKTKSITKNLTAIQGIIFRETWMPIIGCVVFIILLITFCLIMAEREKREQAYSQSVYDMEESAYYMEESILDLTSVKLDIDAEYVKGKNYNDIITIFEEFGFESIETIALKDLTTGWIDSPNTVKYVTINGRMDFEEGDRFEFDAEIVIYYHSFK